MLIFLVEYNIFLNDLKSSSNSSNLNLICSFFLHRVAIVILLALLFDTIRLTLFDGAPWAILRCDISRIAASTSMVNWMIERLFAIRSSYLSRILGG